MALWLAQMVPLMTALLVTTPAYLLLPSCFVPQQGPAARAAPCAATATVQESATLGHVLASPVGDELVVVDPLQRAQAKVGELVRIGGGGTGVLLMERCGLYFAARLDGEAGAAGSRERVDQMGEQLAVQRAAGAAWGGGYDHLGRPMDAAAGAPEPGELTVFCEPVPQKQRKPIGESVHCGLPVIDPVAAASSRGRKGGDEFIE